MNLQETGINTLIMFAEMELNWITGGKEAVTFKSKDKQSKEDFFKACQSFACGEYKEALKIFENLRKKSPTEKMFLSGLIATSIALQDNKSNAFLESIGIKSNTAAYFYLQGVIEEINGNYPKAVQKYMEALEKKDDFVPALFRLAYYLDVRGNDHQALALYEKGIVNESTFCNILINLGVLYEDLNQYYKASECYKRILKKYPTHKRALLFLKDAEDSINMYVDEEKEREQDRQNQVLATPISDFELSVRSKNCLSKMKIKTLGDLIKKTEAELLSYKNFGETSLSEIKEILAKKNLRLGMGREEEGINKKKERKISKPVKMSTNQEVMSVPVSNLELSVRSRKCLTILEIKTVGDLLQKSEKELLNCKNFGHTSMQEIKQKLMALGVSLRDG